MIPPLYISHVYRTLVNQINNTATSRCQVILSYAYGDLGHLLVSGKRKPINTWNLHCAS